MRWCSGKRGMAYRDTKLSLSREEQSRLKRLKPVVSTPSTFTESFRGILGQSVFNGSYHFEKHGS